MYKKLILNISQSKLNYYIGLSADLLTATILFFLSFKTLAENNIGSISSECIILFALFILGIFVCTFLEYWIHRWLFHYKHNSSLLKLFTKGHANHHKKTFNYDAMPFFTIPLISILLLKIFSIIFLPYIAYALTAGLTMGYFYYGIVHHLMHRKNSFINNSNNGYWAYMSDFHFFHHERPKTNFGVTTDIWDRIFKTYSGTYSENNIENDNSKYLK